MESKYLYGEITKEVWQALRRLLPDFKAHPGLSEVEKRNALYYELKKGGWAVSKEVPVIHRHNGQRVGVGFMDLVIDNRVVVEVKNLEAIRQKDIEQLELYMKDSGYPVGVLVNFGFLQANLELPQDRAKVFVRCYCRDNDPSPKSQA